MSEYKKPCSICVLGDGVCKEVARLFAVGLPASDVVSYLAAQGHRRTQRQLVDHRRHVVSPASPRLAAVVPSSASSPDETEEPLTKLVDLTDIQREDLLILGFLEATESMLASLKQTGSIKVSRAAVELGSLAHTMLKDRMTRAVPLDPVINLVMRRVRLEEVLATKGQLEDS